MQSTDDAMEFFADQTGDVFVRVRPDGSILHISGSVRALGHEPKSLIGLSGLHLVHPEDQPKFIANTEAALRGEKLSPRDRVHRFRTAGGQWLWMEGNPRVIRDEAGQITEIINVLRDVSERRNAEAEAAAQSAIFRSAFEHAGVGKAIVALDGRFLSINAAFCQLVGYSEPAMLALDFQTITHPEDLDIDLDLLDQLTRGQIPNYRLDKRYLKADGSIVWVQLTVSMLRDEAGAPKLYMAQVQDLTQRLHAEAALRESEERYRLLAENASDVIMCVSPDAHLTYLSPSVEALLGYRPEELIGRETRAIIHPEDYPRSLRMFSEHLAGPARAQPFRFEYRGVRKDGSLVWLAAHPRAVFHSETGQLTGFQDVVRDVTAQRATEAALAISENRFRMLAENSSDLVMESRPDGALAYLSPGCATLTGYTPEEVLGRTALTWLHPDDRALVVEAFQEQVASGGAARARKIEYRLMAKDGRTVWMESSPRAKIDPASGQVVGVTDTARDVTARKALEAGLAQARDAAEEAARVKADFLANMSHEIRTPLTAIIGFTSLLKAREDVAGDARYQVERISGAGQALLAIVNDVLDFSKLEAGQMPIDRRASDIRQTVADSVALFEPQAAAKGIALRVEELADLPVADIDPDRLRQILLNLVGNAVKFTAEGAVVVTAGYDAAAERLTIEVIDSGRGMDEDQQAKLFQRFSQVDASSTRKHGGTGLGLAICRHLVEAMGGEVGVRSSSGSGSTFWFYIAAPKADPVQSHSQAESADLEGLRVLVADDNAVNREITRALLTPFGVTISEAEDGLAAVRMASQEPFDLILMDVRMPGCDGPDAVLQIRTRQGPNANIPILAFTADFDIERYGEQATRGFDGIVRKPISAPDMIAEIVRHTAFDITDLTSGSAAA